MNEKDELLYQNIQDINISTKTFLITIASVIAIVMLFAPKIYIQNNIYYKSNKIQNDIYPTYRVLKEENIQLRLKFEKEFFRNQTMDLELNEQ
jgi:hypothetical protein